MVGGCPNWGPVLKVAEIRRIVENILENITSRNPDKIISNLFIITSDSKVLKNRSKKNRTNDEDNIAREYGNKLVTKPGNAEDEKSTLKSNWRILANPKDRTANTRK